MKKNIGLVLFFHLLGLAILSVVRIIFLCLNLPAGNSDCTLTLRALAIGIQFDNWVLSFITALPLLAAIIATFCRWNTLKLKKFLNVWYFTFFSILLVFSVADIPYFTYFQEHLNIGIFDWFAFAGDTFGMLFAEVGNYFYLAIIGALIFLYVKLALEFEKWLLKKLENESSHSLALQIPIVILLLGGCFLGMRGTLQRYPLRAGMAYFSDNAFYNRLGLNPVFNMVESAKTHFNSSPEEIQQRNLEQAFAAVKKEVGCEMGGLTLTRKIQFPNHNENHPNIVIILLESISVNDVERTEKGRLLMPYLANLRQQGCYFTNFYSAGNHTNNGITATLYGFAPNFSQPTMTVPSVRYAGLPQALKKSGYQNHFFITGNPQYDHMNSFLYDNGFDKIHSLYDYPADKAVNNFGVADDYLFEYGIEQLDALSETGTPFCAVFLTVSNHPPYIVPREYMEVAETDENRMLSYVDETIRDFMQTAQRKDWYENTIFVLLGDHGNAKDETIYDTPLQYNHIPCHIISSKYFSDNKKITIPCGQVDLFAFLMETLQIPYENQTLGTNPLRNPKAYAFFVRDSQLACLDTTYYYCYNLNSKKDYLYRLGNAEDLSQTFPEQKAAMKDYCFDRMAVNNFLLKNIGNDHSKK